MTKRAWTEEERAAVSAALGDEGPQIPKDARDTLLSWEAARPLLDYEHGGGFGSPDCHAITAWTASRVIFVHEYDGATSVRWLPRHPTTFTPEFDGTTR